MPSRPIEGVVPILVTPFDEDERIDFDSLERLIEFDIAAGVHGLGSQEKQGSFPPLSPSLFHWRVGPAGQGGGYG